METKEAKGNSFKVTIAFKKKARKLLYIRVRGGYKISGRGGGDIFKIPKIQEIGTKKSRNRNMYN